MTCSRCGHETAPQAKFCEECGARLVRRCSRCGTSLTASAKFCTECGEPIAGEVTSPVPTRFSTPDAYTPRHLAEQILVSRTALEGERKQVTVLFADLKGSMELLATRDPEEAKELLDPVLERMMEAVHFYEGTVNQVMGDGIMALFGAPVAHEDHAIRACYAALRMQDGVRKYAEARAAPVQIRVGVNSGEVVVRSVGSDLRMDYSAIGQTTHVAARLEQAASPGSILISTATMRLVEDWVRASFLGRVPIKGLSEPLDVFEVVGATRVRSRLQARAGHGLTKFVGRDFEVEQLMAALKQTLRGQGQVVGLIADAGVGKSRICAEFMPLAYAQGCSILETGCVSYRKATAYLPIIELLRGYFQIEEKDDSHKIREKVSGKVLSLEMALEPYLAAFQWLLDVPPDDPSWPQLDPQQRRQRTVEGVKRLLLREAQVQPLVVLFEDLHWLDGETQAFLDSLVESLPTARLLLLVNYRREYSHGWGGKSYYRQIRIEPLAASTAEQLLRALLGDDPVLDDLKRRLVERTEGNPFFLEETVRTLRETRLLVGEPGSFHLTRNIQNMDVAPTVQAILAARIDRLPDDEKRLLQSAAVVGTEVPFSLLADIAAESNEDLRRGLSHLVAAEFLYESRLFPDLEFSFRHALTHDVAYKSLLHDRRRAMHVRIVQSIERLHAERLAEHVEGLAHHAFRGEVWDKAVTYCRQAGLKAEGRSAHREAVSWFEQAIGAVRRLPETRETLEQVVDLRLSLRGSLYPLGDFESILAHLREAEALAHQLDDQQRLGWVSLHVGDYLRQTGKFSESCVYSERAYAIAEKLQNLPLKMAACQYLGLSWHALGDYGRAADLLRTVVEIPLGGPGIGEWRTQAGSRAGFLAVNYAWLARSLADAGNFDEAIAFGRKGLELAETLQTPYSIAATTFALGSVLGMRGDWAQGIPLLERSRDTTRDWNIPLYECHALRALGYSYLRVGRVDEGLALLKQSAATVEARSLAVQEARVMAMLGEAWLAAGHPDEATASASRGLSLAQQRGQRGDEATALAVLGQIAAAADPPDWEAAERHYAAAIAIAAELRMRPLLARCHLALGQLQLRRERPDLAQEQLAASAVLCCEMDMRFLLRLVRTTLTQLGPKITVAPE